MQNGFSHLKYRDSEVLGQMRRKSVQSVFAGLLVATVLSCTACGGGDKKEQSAVSVTAKENEVKKKEQVKLLLSEAKTLPDKIDGAEFQSKNKRIATVSKDGVVHGVKHGKTTIVMKSKNETITYTVKVAKKGMVYPKFTMLTGEHLDIQFSNGTKAKNVKWKTTDKSIATVDKKGKIIAKKKGKIQIKGNDGKKTYVAGISVKKRPKNIIYLTFDDGPNSYTTPKILKILKKNNVKATFFELRPASYDYKLTKRVIDEGHTLALHGFKHKYYEIYKSEKVYKGNLDKLRNLFFKKFGVWCTVSRFPGGSSNTVSRYNKGIMTRLTKKLDGWGYHYFDWNVDSEDAGGARNPQQTFHNVTSALCKGRGNVVLMHDFYGNDKTINALDKMIKYGKKHGYVFLPITASTDAVHHGVNN